jgi:hypothetical protein
MAMCNPEYLHRYMDHRMLNKEHSFKSFENTLHYDPNAF